MGLLRGHLSVSPMLWETLKLPLKGKAGRPLQTLGLLYLTLHTPSHMAVPSKESFRATGGVSTQLMTP